MHTAKQDALNIIQQLPDDADTEEMIYRLYMLENIRRGATGCCRKQNPNR